MKRLFIATSILALLLAAVPAAPAAAADQQGPPCTDLGGSTSFAYSGTGGVSGTVTADVAVPAGSCTAPFPAASYTLHVLNAAGTTELASATVAGNGGTLLAISASVAGGPTPVCAFVTSGLDRTPNTADRLPNTGCVPLVINGGAAGGAFDE